VWPVKVVLRPTAAAMSPAKTSSTFLARVGVQADDAAQALALAGRGVEHVRAGLIVPE